MPHGLTIKFSPLFSRDICLHSRIINLEMAPISPPEVICSLSLSSQCKKGCASHPIKTHSLLSSRIPLLWCTPLHVQKVSGPHNITLWGLGHGSWHKMLLRLLILLWEINYVPDSETLCSMCVHVCVICIMCLYIFMHIYIYTHLYINIHTCTLTFSNSTFPSIFLKNLYIIWIVIPCFYTMSQEKQLRAWTDK